MEVQEPFLARCKATNCQRLVSFHAHPLKRWPVRVTGLMISLPESPNPMERSNRWSMLGVRSGPFSPSRRSSFVESRQGLQWLATAPEIAPIPWTPELCRQRTSAQVGFGLVRGLVAVV